MTPDQIIAATAAAFGTQPDDLLGTCGSPNGRRALVLLLRDLCPDMSNLDIARLVGMAGNASVALTLHKARQQMKTDQAWATAVKRLRKRLKACNDGETISQAMAREQARSRAEIVVPLTEPPPRVPSSVAFVRAQLGRMSEAAIMRSLGLKRESDFRQLCAMARNR